MTIHTVGNHIWCDDEDCAILDKVVTENKRLRAALERILGPMGHDYGLTQQIAREALEGGIQWLTDTA